MPVNRQVSTALYHVYLDCDLAGGRAVSYILGGYGVMSSGYVRVTLMQALVQHPDKSESAVL